MPAAHRCDMGAKLGLQPSFDPRSTGGALDVHRCHDDCRLRKQDCTIIVQKAEQGGQAADAGESSPPKPAFASKWSCAKRSGHRLRYEQNSNIPMPGS